MTLITYLAAFVLNLIVIGLVFPHGFPLVGPIILLLFVWTAMHMLLTDGKVYYDVELLCVYLGLLGFMLLGVGLSPELYPVVRGEMIHAIAGLLIIPVLWRIAAWNRLDTFRQAFAVGLCVLMVGVAVLCLYKFYMQLQGVQLSWLVSVDDGGRYPLGAALQDDYNMSALGLTAGAIACGYLFARTDSMFLRWFLAGGIAIILLAALLTGSRRFYVVFAAALLAALLYGSWRVFRGAAGVLRRFSVRGRAAAHATLVAILLAFVAFTIYPATVELAGAATGGQLDRLFGRLQTLMQFSETLEGSRGPLLRLAFELVSSFTPQQFLLGSGFSYLTALKDGSAEAYPHSPVIAALLYGGLPNVLLVVYALGRAAILYGGRLRSEALFAVLFFVTLAFMLISGNTIFSSQLLVMLLIIGFVLRSRSWRHHGAISQRDEKTLPGRAAAEHEGHVQ